MSVKAPSVELLRSMRLAATASIGRIPNTRTLQPACAFLRTQRNHSIQGPRHLSTSTRRQAAVRRHTKSNAPISRDRGPASKEDTQTDFGKMDILGQMATPATSVDACTSDGFHLNNGIKTSGGSGVLLLDGEAFQWRPWANSQNPNARIGDLLSNVGIMSIPETGFGMLTMLYPKPDLLLIGTGSRLWMLSKEARTYLGSLGIRVDVMDTANAAAAYNLLATERGVDTVGAAFLPVGWRGLVK